MTTKTEKNDSSIINPHYEGATPEMVGRALLRNPEPAPPQKGKEQAEPDA